MPKQEFSKSSGMLYEAPSAMARLIDAATRNSFISTVAAINLFGSEGGFKSSARSPTGATGVAQFTEKAFIETAYLNRDSLPQRARKIIEDNVERHNAAQRGHAPIYKYRVMEGGNERAVLNLRRDPEVSAILGVKHMEWTAEAGWKKYQDILKAKIDHIESTYKQLPQERLRILKEHMGRDMTVTDLKIMYVCGIKGGSKLLAAMAEETVTHDQSATGYATRALVNSNPHVFKKDGKVNRSVPEFVDYIQERVGTEKIYFDRKGSSPLQTRIATTIQAAVEPLKNLFQPKAATEPKTEPAAVEAKAGKLVAFSENKADLKKRPGESNDGHTTRVAEALGWVMESQGVDSQGRNYASFVAKPKND